VQLRFDSGYTSEEYVSAEGWREARLSRCPRHPGGGCGFTRHGTYRRKTPLGALVARWYCRKAHETFSALPDCLAARLPGALLEVETVVRAVEAAPSVEAAADVLRPDIELPGAVRWTRRRVRAVHRSLSTLRGLLPQTFASCPSTLTAFAERLGVALALPALRAVAADFLHELPAPLGLQPRLGRGGEVARAHQQPMGPDPPPRPR
jgi:hypothetical protein